MGSKEREALGEALGTFLLVLLTVGSAANATLSPRLGPQAFGYDALALGSGLGVLVGVLCARPLSQAHLNPAVTLALALRGLFPWGKVFPYLLGQFLGGVFRGPRGLLGLPGGPPPPGDAQRLLHRPQPAPWRRGLPLEGSLGTFTLMAVVLQARPAHLLPLWLGLTVAGVGYGLGGPGGFALNPARDLSPRLLASLLGAEGAASPYALVPLFGPLLGAGLAAFLLRPGPRSP
ncbi:MIP/aquaporin family protein [Thermus oshimai]|uniref:MIP/aquaporin family protein n=1 Tax=Thermus oshimai TaxID=56957 RepID=UPI0003AB071B|nr:MIP/aquaporin family protein [Thermus oshimai]